MADAFEAANGLPAAELAELQARSDLKGLVRLLGHGLAIAGSGAFYAWSLVSGLPRAVSVFAAIAYGFTLVTLFAAMHESVHRTAFNRRALNAAVGWIAGLLSFYNSSFYRPYHGWHHRFTQIAGKDPELEDPKPTNLVQYLLELSGVGWWIGKLRTYYRLALGRTETYGFLNAQNRAPVVRSVRLQLAVYALAATYSWFAGYPYFLVYWLAPVALAQPLLRFILLAEHTGCAESADPLSNTRTTLTLWPVRYLMWEMPYHAEHHRYPALPFFALSRAHGRIGDQFVHVARHGYSGMHRELIGRLLKGAAQASEP